MKAYKKILIISRVSDKISDYIADINDREISNISIILKCGILEKNFDIAIALNQNKTLKGIISLGDLRRLVNKKLDQTLFITNYLNKDPITVTENDLNSNLYSKLYFLRKNIIEFGNPLESIRIFK